MFLQDGLVRAGNEPAESMPGCRSGPFKQRIRLRPISGACIKAHRLFRAVSSNAVSSHATANTIAPSSLASST